MTSQAAPTLIHTKVNVHTYKCIGRTLLLATMATAITAMISPTIDTFVLKANEDDGGEQEYQREQQVLTV